MQSILCNSIFAGFLPPPGKHTVGCQMMPLGFLQLALPITWPCPSLGLPRQLSGKESVCQCRRCRRCRRCEVDLWVGKIPWRRKWQPTSPSLPGKSHGHRSLAGYNPWSCKESDRPEHMLPYVTVWLQVLGRFILYHSCKINKRIVILS